jgi:hypothetical protein
LIDVLWKIGKVKKEDGDILELMDFGWISADWGVAGSGVATF